MLVGFFRRTMWPYVPGFFRFFWMYSQGICCVSGLYVRWDEVREVGRAPLWSRGNVNNFLLQSQSSKFEREARAQAGVCLELGQCR